MLHKADVVFVMDSSGSVVLGNFEKAKRFVKKTVGHFNIDRNHTLVSLIEYSSVPNMVFNLQDMTDIVSFMEAVDNVTYSGGGTLTSDALLMMRTEGYVG